MTTADDTYVQPQDYPQLPNPRVSPRENRAFASGVPAIPPVTAQLIRDKYNKGNLALRKETHDYRIGSQELF